MMTAENLEKGDSPLIAWTVLEEVVHFHGPKQ